MRLDHVLSAPCLLRPIIFPRLQTERVGKWRGPLTAWGRRDAGTFQRGLLAGVISSAPARRRRGARLPRAEPEPLPHPPRERRCGVRAGRGPEPSAACEGDSVPGLPGFVAGAGSRRIYDSVLPGRKRPEPPPRRGLQSPGVRRREELDPPTLSASRPAPASGRPRPHEDPPAGAECRAPPGPRSGRDLRALARSVRWHVRQRASCGQERRRPRGAPRPPQGHRGRVPGGRGRERDTVLPLTGQV